MVKLIPLVDGELNLNLSNPEDVEALKNLLSEAYYKSGNIDTERNVNLHFATTEACYSSELNLTVNAELGNIEKQIHDEIIWMSRKEEPTKHLMVTSKAILGFEQTIEVNISI